MSPRPGLSLCASLAFLLFVTVDTVHAAPLPFTQVITLGKPSRAGTLTAEVTAQGLLVQVGGRAHTLPLAGASELSVETVALDENAAVNVLRAKAAGGELLAIFGGRRGDELLLAERGDFHGDPGERTRTVVAVHEAAGHNVLTVGVRHEAVALCGGHEALFRRRTVDPRTLTLVAAETPALSASDLREVVASAASTASASVLRALDAVTSSHVDDAGPLTPTPPLALVDGNLETAWTTTHRGARMRGEFAILRFRGKGFPIERVVLIPPASGPGLPRSLWLLADALTLHVSVPEAPRGGIEIALPAPLDARCVALVIDEPAQPNEPVAIAEAQVSTAIEREGGLERLVTLLVQDDPRADDIASALGELGHEAATRVAGRYDELSPSGKRRALRVLVRHLDLTVARDRVLRAARTDEALRETALAGLRAAGEPGRRGLRELALDGTPIGDLAASWLSRETGEAGPLLQALGTEAGPSRPALREALVGIARRESAAFDTAVATWLASTPSVPSRVALSLVLSATGQHADRAASVAEQALPEVTAFDDRYRLSLSLSKAGPSPVSDAWLEQAARTSVEWMMRRVAFEALLARDPMRATGVAAVLARDAYPRVRAVALASLATSPARNQVEASATDDGWPLVRVAAVNALAGSPEASPTLRKAVDDTSRRVRSAAIEALAGLADREAWNLVQARLTAPGEWPEVHAAAMRFARALCIQEAREPLLFALRRAIRTDATEDDVRLGLEALRALHDLGGEAAAEGLLVANRDGSPPGLVRVAKQLPAPRCHGASASPTP